MLNQKVAIYVPTTNNVNQPAEELTKIFVLQAKMLLANLFGGFTVYEAMGGWVSESVGLVEEKVFIVQAYTSDLSSLDQVIEFAKTIALRMGQECVTVETNQGLMFVTQETESESKMVA